MSGKSTTSARAVRLSQLAVTYLANTKFLPARLDQIVKDAVVAENGEQILQLDRETAEQFRDEFTTRLARVGFGPDYEPTREGRLLEELIDRFAN